MSTGDIRVIDFGGRNVAHVRKFNLPSGAGGTTTPSINAGEPVKISLPDATISGPFYPIPLVDGDGATPTDVYFLGIAANASTETSSATGFVDVYVDHAGDTVYRIKPKVAGEANTTTEIEHLQFDRFVIDLTSSTYTLDAGAAESAVNEFMVIGGDATEDSLDFISVPNASWKEWGGTA